MLRLFSLRSGILRQFVLLVAVFALAMQIAVGAVASGPNNGQTQSLNLPFTVVMCHADGAGGGAQHRHRQADCAACPFCQAFAQAAGLLLPPLIDFYYQPLRLVALARAPAAHAPPGCPLTIYPTGPPLLA